MLENRSFDHMLGFLDHPFSTYPNLMGDETNDYTPPGTQVRILKNQSGGMPVDPAHDHSSVLHQLTNNPQAIPPYSLNNDGFVNNYEQVGQNEGKSGVGPEIMKCQAPCYVPVLAELAKSFAVCTKWFCSVPGQTWPNRNFAHAATSDGEVNINKRPYYNPTIFEQLSASSKDWRIYKCGFTAQADVFKNLWGHGYENRFQKFERFLSAAKSNKLPHYSFIEPDHLTISPWDNTNNQHPGNNEKDDTDFRAGEKLIHDVYLALASNEEVWLKSLLLVIYDEHGGFFDREPPPVDPRYEVKEIYKDAGYEFRFNLLGPRVPAIVISPYVRRGDIDNTIYDHTSIPRTIREILLKDDNFLSDREANANSFDKLLTLSTPRLKIDIPDFQQWKQPDSKLTTFSPPSKRPQKNETKFKLDEFQESLLWLYEAKQRATKHELDEIEGKTYKVDEKAPEPTTAQRLQRFKEFRTQAEAAKIKPFTILRTNEFVLSDQPSTETLRQELEIFQQNANENDEIWLDDTQGHILSLQTDGTLKLIDMDRQSIKPSGSIDDTVNTFHLLSNGQLETLRSIFK